MADPIGDTPELVGKEAEDFLNSLDKPLSERKKEIIREMNAQRRVYFWDCPNAE
jgi:hypothetical protein